MAKRFILMMSPMRCGKARSRQPVKSQQGSFWETFTKYAEKGVRCIYVAFSSKLSGTCNTARMVAEEVRLRYPQLSAYNLRFAERLSCAGP